MSEDVGVTNSGSVVTDELRMAVVNDMLRFRFLPAEVRQYLVGYRDAAVGALASGSEQ